MNVLLCCSRWQTFKRLWREKCVQKIVLLLFRRRYLTVPQNKLKENAVQQSNAARVIPYLLLIMNTVPACPFKRPCITYTSSLHFLISHEILLPTQANSFLLAKKIAWPLDMTLTDGMVQHLTHRLWPINERYFFETYLIF